MVDPSVESARAVPRTVVEIDGDPPLRAERDDPRAPLDLVRRERFRLAQSLRVHSADHEPLPFDPGTVGIPRVRGVPRNRVDLRILSASALAGRVAVNEPMEISVSSDVPRVTPYRVVRDRAHHLRPSGVVTGVPPVVAMRAREPYVRHRQTFPRSSTASHPG